MHTSRNSRGFSFIETIVNIMIFVFIMIAIVMSVRYFYRTNAYVLGQASAVTSAQRGVEDTVKTMRESAYASNGAYPVVSIAAHDVTFYSDIDSDLSVERIRYYVSGTSLLRDVTSATGDPPTYGGVETSSVISETVRNITQGVPTFTYFDAAGVEVTNYANVASVRFISMAIMVDVDPNRAPDPTTIRSTATIRNLR